MGGRVFGNGKIKDFGGMSLRDLPSLCVHPTPPVHTIYYCSTTIYHSRDFAGEGGERLAEGEHFGEHRGSQAQHGHGSQGQGRGDDANDGAGEHGQQVPGLDVDSSGRGAEPERERNPNTNAQVFHVSSPFERWLLWCCGWGGGLARLCCCGGRRGSILVPGCQWGVHWLGLQGRWGV